MKPNGTESYIKHHQSTSKPNNDLSSHRFFGGLPNREITQRHTAFRFDYLIEREQDGIYFPLPTTQSADNGTTYTYLYVCPQSGDDRSACLLLI